MRGTARGESDMKTRIVAVLAAVGWVCATGAGATDPLQVSGIYPHLAFFNQYGECGIGGVVPWAGKLWVMTYPPHMPTGGQDKLYAISPDLSRITCPESVGGTHAGRMIHAESKQLVMGPYFIGADGTVRAADVHKLVGRMTAVARHLTDPANKVYEFDMEGAIYEVDVHTLAVTKLFAKPVPGWHGKGGYTSQGRLVIANNGESGVGKGPKTFLADSPNPKDPENAGVLAEWDGKTWRVLERRAFTEVTGPAGIDAVADDKGPLWSIGWDRRSLILKLLDGGTWSNYRLPKASHAFDPKHGYYTEWPRIREIAPGRLMMAMHGMLFDFPKTFSAANTAGLAPLCSHLRYITDFCDWNGRLVISADDSSIMQNPMAGRSQSNLLFTEPAELKTWGPRSGWGGPWDEDAVKAGAPSEPFLVRGFDRRALHLAHNADAPVNFTLEADVRGDGKWSKCGQVAVPAKGYVCHLLPPDFDAQWLRFTVDRDCTATAYLHLSSDCTKPDPALFAALATPADAAVCAGFIRPGTNCNLQWVARVAEAGKAAPAGYFEADEKLAFAKPAEDKTEEVEKICKIGEIVTVDAASAIVKWGENRRRLPVGGPGYDTPSAFGPCRMVREVQSERNLMDVAGIFYEMPREKGLPLIRPVCTHNKQILDFCTWRGLLVLSGTRRDAKPDGHYFSAGEGLGLWFGKVDDLWKMGKPVGRGGPWMKTEAKADVPSDPYLMTGFDKKTMTLSHDGKSDVAFTVEVDFDHRGWHCYQTFRVPAGQTVTHEFPAGFSAHWLRVSVDQSCSATAQLSYE